MESLPLVFSSGWASGVNCYLVVLVLGLADRIVGYAGIPDVLGRWDVLGVALLLYAMEFVADKIPLIDSTWDAISTALRPTAGAVVGVLLAGDAATLQQAVAGVLGGGTALVSHLVKAGTRLAVNTSPEPASNVLLSVLEDLAVLIVVAIGVLHPRVAAGIAGVLLAAGLIALLIAGKLVRRGWRRRQQRRRARLAGPPG